MMDITTAASQKLDMVRFNINTGAQYDGPQTVVANLEKATELGGTWSLIFQIADDSRCMYEKVEVVTTWPLIRECQNDTKTARGIDRMARRIMDQYLMSRYVN